MRYTTLDTETFYDKDYSIKDLGNWNYTHDPRFDCYLVSIASSDGFRWTGHPTECPWKKVIGDDVVLLSVNVGFDMAVTDRMAEQGLIPKLVYARWYDVGDLSSYVGAPRSLAGAAATLLGKEMSKDVRTRMSGKHFRDLPADKQQEVIDYAQDDADIPLEIWQKHSHRWPEHERWLSVHTREMGRKGMPVNLARVNEGIAILQTQLDDALAKIPWAAETGTPLSKKHMALRCAEDGIEMPASMAKDSEECAAWEDKYADTYEWIRAVRVYRRVNMLLEKLISVRDRTLNGNFLFSIKYWGGHTGRWSGAGGVNMQNLPKKEMFGVDLRRYFEAPEGCTFCVVDLSQIEPRVTAYLARDKELMEFITNCSDLYEAQARAWGLYSDPEPLAEKAPDTRFLVKTCNIGLCYQMGAKRLNETANLGMVESQRLVDLYRAKNPKLRQLWDAIGKHMRNHAGTGQPCEFELPSGRSMKYLDVRNLGEISAVLCQDGKMQRLKLFPGRVLENLVQALARDVLAWHMRLIENAGIEIRLTIHDEVVCLVREETAEQDLATVSGIMHTAPPWAPGLPVAAKGVLSKVYTK